MAERRAERRSAKVNLRHSAALALVGWYLMVPPREEGSSKLSLGVPISNWVHLDSFDSASECRQTAYRAQEQFKQDPERAVQYAAWMCIATDDPRLKESSR